MLSHAFTWDNANILACMARDAYLEPKEFKKKYKKAKFIENDGTECYVWPVPPPEGVGKSTTYTVVASCISIVILDYVLAAILL